MTYKIQCKETGDPIEVAIPSMVDALTTLFDYEKKDKEEGIYEPDFYEIVEDEE